MQDDAEGWRQALKAMRESGTETFASGLKKARETLSWHTESNALVSLYSGS